MLFDLGWIVGTRGAMSALEVAGHNPHEFITRHESGDWGELDHEDRQTNDRAVQNGLRILSTYTTRTGDEIWIITEADRSLTTILLPEEY